ncbi:uncharacterized protein si:ch211-149e23.4 isoform X2 [Melanotaenia boesemani]|uniref:uncharacterized protein si:ch211-149e23.4 isoform X2 n=1 Tax=Melanotaenia boesemani TaxID=1250792 RepID=UPI001C03D636|nr:uncharacterized protein si:ch211-149e23.4 isoform X2 [Melanotaenia boesemani]
MGCSRLLVLGLVLNVAHCLETEGSGAEQTHVISHNVTAVLGETVYLSCTYLGESQILGAEWKRQLNAKSTFKRLAGFSNGKPFGRNDFSNPESPTNLTVQMRVNSVEAEGEYLCEFESEEEYFSGSVFVTVLAQPDVQIQVNEKTIDATHYQSVSCSAIGGRPAPQISWLIGGLPPSDNTFNVDVTETIHSNGTSTLSSILHFPTHLQDEDSVTCVVQHMTLPNPKLTTVRVETYARPNVTIKAEMIQQGGNDFWVVSCISSGGRPETDMSLALKMTEELQRENVKDTDVQILSVHLSATDYEGQNITCMFNHPKFTQVESRVVTLPVFYLSGVQIHSKVGISSDGFQGTKYLELQEGLSEAVINLKVMGNVPRYKAICKKDDGPLPEGVELVASSLMFQGSVAHQHAGLYECDFSYHHLNTTLRLNVTVKPQAQQLVPPTIRVDLRVEDGHRVIECVAADAVPAANVSWLLPEGVSADFWFNSTTSSESHSVRGVLLLPACLPWELTAECVINHSAFEEPENRSVTLPLCARPNITISVSSEWKDGHKYTTVHCSAVSVASAAAISWHAANNSISSLTETEVQVDGLVSAQSSVHFPSSLYAGQNLTCMVKHLSLETPEKLTVYIPVHKAAQLSVSLVKLQDSSLWMAVCDYRGEGVGTNLAWVLPENTRGETSLNTKYEGHIINARLTYQFPLALHEGQDLTCVHQFEHGITEKKTVHIPKYYISSLGVLNHTTPLHSRYSDQPVIYRLSVHENHHNQKILLRVEGNVPEYSIDCRRSDGSIVQMNGAAMIIQPELSGQDKALYTCWASFYHHTATVNIQVEFTREDEQLMLVTMICIPSAFAILLLLIIFLCVCCKRNNRAQYKRESVSALTALMQDPGSSEVNKSAAATEDSKEYDHINYSIVIDVKSTV